MIKETPGTSVWRQGILNAASKAKYSTPNVEENNMQEKKYAALIEESYYTPGDERSRTNPGHGYPGGTTYYTGIRKFKDKEEMINFVRQHKSCKYELICYSELKVETEVLITVKE